jgi:hypothetical protein
VVPGAVRYLVVAEEAPHKCKRLAVHRFRRIMNAGENPMEWFYEIRDSNKAVAESGKGFATHSAAMAAGRKKARELKASGSLPGGEIGTVRAAQDSEALEQ